MKDDVGTVAKAVSPEHWVWVHPLPQGHELIARNWLEQVSGRFLKSRKQKGLEVPSNSLILTYFLLLSR
ncbi:MAG TPA: hypothetical protein EYQ14_06750 [Gammaproteobacteria bacterium]|nr:hypothetical protein [Gammaproteobacteria bacterium]